MNKNDLKACYDSLFRQFSYTETIQISREERNFKNLNTSNYTYGEIEYIGVQRILSTVFQEFGEQDYRDKTFIDLGSGIGKAVFAFALLGQFKKSTGIEILENVYTMASLVKEVYDKKGIVNGPKVEFMNRDLNEVELMHYDFVFTNSTCWSDDTMARLGLKVDMMEKGSIFVNTDRQIALRNNWIKLKPFNVKTSWGYAKTFIYKRI
jgi:hypothetical protein